MRATGRIGAAALLAAAALSGRAGAAVTAAPGWAVRTIPTPATVQGGVVRRGGAVIVGQGAFGAGLQSIVRLDRDGATTIATGFNALGGFDLDGDGTLLVVDSCAECPGATTGDTLYAVPDALTRTTALAAADLEVVSAGSLPAALDVAIAPDGAALVTDAAGPGAGRVVRVASGVATPLVTGLDFLGGIAVFPDDTLRVANVDGSFAGAVLRYDGAGAPLGALATGLSGAYGVAVDGTQHVLVSGGFTGDFTSSTVVAFAPDGTPAERARGFAFSSDLFHDGARDETLVLDFGVQEVTVLCRDVDGDGACDCPAVAKPKLKLAKLATPGGDDVVSVKGQVSMPAEPAVDPVATGVQVRIEGGAGVVLDAVIAPGAYDEGTGTGWQAKNGKFKWKHPTGVAGIRKVTIATTAETPGLVKFVVAGKGASVAVGPADLPLRARVGLAADDGQCGDLRFPGPAPACVLAEAKGKVICK